MARQDLIYLPHALLSDQFCRAEDRLCFQAFCRQFTCRNRHRFTSCLVTVHRSPDQWIHAQSFVSRRENGTNNRKGTGANPQTIAFIRYEVC
jgi:hypothetical protein